MIFAFVFAYLFLFGSIGCPTSDVYGRKSEDGLINITAPCNYNCDCPISRPDPICSKDGITNLYSPCVAGCKDVKKVLDAKRKKVVKVYTDCECAAAAWNEHNATVLERWHLEDYIDGQKPHDKIAVDKPQVEMHDIAITEAVEGWCNVDCETEKIAFMTLSLLVALLGATGRIGNVLIALRLAKFC